MKVQINLPSETKGKFAGVNEIILNVIVLKKHVFTSPGGALEFLFATFFFFKATTPSIVTIYKGADNENYANTSRSG